MADQDSKGTFSPEEAQRRFEAAIRGARIVGHREMKDIPRKRRAKRMLSTAKPKKRDRTKGEM